MCHQKHRIGRQAVAPQGEPGEISRHRGAESKRNFAILIGKEGGPQDAAGACDVLRRTALHLQRHLASHIGLEQIACLRLDGHRQMEGTQQSVQRQAVIDMVHGINPFHLEPHQLRTFGLQHHIGVALRAVTLQRVGLPAVARALALRPEVHRGGS